MLPDIEIRKGSKEAVSLVCSIIETLLTFIFMIEVINSVLNEIGDSVGKWLGQGSTDRKIGPRGPRDPTGGPWIPGLGQEINWMTLESLTFVIFVPCAWLMGIPYEEVTIAANVLAKKGFHKTRLLTRDLEWLKIHVRKLFSMNLWRFRIYKIIIK